MKLLSCAITTTGKRRKNNEDNYFINGHICKKENAEYEIYENIAENKGIYAACDGMGGYSSGDVAAFICVRMLKEYQNYDINTIIYDYISNSNEKICEFIKMNSGIKSGSTLALLYINNGKAKVYNIGDSRVYIFKDGKLTQLSVDHTQAQRMINIGLLTIEQAKSDPGKHVLTQHIGIPSEELIITPSESEEISISAGDKFLLCSDGLTDMIDDEKIENLLSNPHTYLSSCKELVETALDNGGKDNITAIVVEIL